ncbi:MAG: response regulator [Spirochaetaceae bacterium]|jgi:DNA-binding NtrC family response regulator|nr:response regulator [Spirochaetaceae bacterium]
MMKNGLESIEIFNKKYNEIDIVLMDMIMPKMNGSEAFCKMKEIDENCKVYRMGWDADIDAVMFVIGYFIVLISA